MANGDTTNGSYREYVLCWTPPHDQRAHKKVFSHYNDAVEFIETKVPSGSKYHLRRFDKVVTIKVLESGEKT